MTDLFRRGLAAYASLHRDARNKATHAVGIPVVVFSLLLIPAPWRIEPAGCEAFRALVTAAFAVPGWLALDLGIGTPTSPRRWQKAASRHGEQA